MTSVLKGPVRQTPVYINIYNAYLHKLLSEQMFPDLPPHDKTPADSEISYDDWLADTYFIDLSPYIVFCFSLAFAAILDFHRT